MGALTLRKYYNYLIGYNSRLDAVQAAILRVKLRHLDEFVEKRRSNAHFYNESLREAGYKVPEGWDHCSPRHSIQSVICQARRRSKAQNSELSAGKL